MEHQGKSEELLRFRECKEGAGNNERSSGEEKENLRGQRVARIECFCLNGVSVSFG